MLSENIKHKLKETQNLRANFVNKINSSSKINQTPLCGTNSKEPSKESATVHSGKILSTPSAEWTRDWKSRSTRSSSTLKTIWPRWMNRYKRTRQRPIQRYWVSRKGLSGKLRVGKSFSRQMGLGHLYYSSVMNPLNHENLFNRNFKIRILGDLNIFRIWICFLHLICKLN